MCYHNSVLGELRVAFGTPLGEDSQKLALGFLQMLLGLLFLFADFGLCSFTVIIRACEYNYMHSWQELREMILFFLSGSCQKAHDVDHAIASDINPDYLTMLVSASHLHLKFVIFFPFVID